MYTQIIQFLFKSYYKNKKFRAESIHYLNESCALEQITEVYVYVCVRACVYARKKKIEILLRIKKVIPFENDK